MINTSESSDMEARATYQLQADYLSKKMRVKARQIKRLRAHLKKVASATQGPVLTETDDHREPRRHSRRPNSDLSVSCKTTASTSGQQSLLSTDYHQHSSTHSIALKLFKDIKTLQLKILNETDEERFNAAYCKENIN